MSGGSPTQSTGRLAYLTEATLKRFDSPLICFNFCKAISIKDKKSFTTLFTIGKAYIIMVCFSVMKEKQVQN